MRGIYTMHTQREGWVRILDHFARPNAAREVGVVLPVACGKSGVIAITPFARQARSVLVIARGTRIRGQLGMLSALIVPQIFMIASGFCRRVKRFPKR
jgi:hypothetical protein